MPDNSISWIFWVLALVSVAAAIYAVNIKKYRNSFFGLSALLLAVCGLLLSLGYVAVAAVYVIISGAVLVIMGRLTKFCESSNSDSGRLEFYPRVFLNIVLSMLVFAGCLFLISHTGVWQYRTAQSEGGSSEFLQSLIGNNLVLVILPGLFLMVLAPLLFKKLRKRDS